MTKIGHLNNHQPPPVGNNTAVIEPVSELGGYVIRQEVVKALNKITGLEFKRIIDEADVLHDDSVNTFTAKRHENATDRESERYVKGVYEVLAIVGEKNLQIDEKDGIIKATVPVDKRGKVLAAARAVQTGAEPAK